MKVFLALFRAIWHPIGTVKQSNYTNKMNRNEYRNQTIATARAETKLDRNLRPVHFSYKAKLRFLACVHDQLAPALDAKRKADAMMDSIGSGRMAVNGQGRMQSRGKSLEAFGYSVGSFDVPVTYAKQAERETVANVETLDRGVDYVAPVACFAPAPIQH